MKLSENFTLEELCITHVGAENEPSLDHIENLQRLVDNVLQPLRNLYGKPIKVNSGFRSQSVNKKVGGSSSSQHCKGEAADLTCDNNKILFELIKNNLPFDQLINEMDYAWIHVSYRECENRKQVLKMIDGKYYPA